VIYENSAWTDFIAAMVSSPTLAPIAPLFVAELSGDGVPDWQTAARLLGVNSDVVDGLGLGSQAGTDEAPAALVDAEINISGG